MKLTDAKLRQIVDDIVSALIPAHDLITKTVERHGAEFNRLESYFQALNDLARTLDMNGMLIDGILDALGNTNWQMAKVIQGD